MVKSCNSSLYRFLLGISVLALTVCGPFSLAHAAEVRLLTLDQALQLADSRNHDIRKAREFYRQVEGRYVEERSAALPQLTLSGSVARQQDDSQSAIAAGLIPTRQDTQTVDLGLNQVLFAWGKVGAAIRAAEKGFRTADERLRISQQDTRRDVTAAFYDILLARELHSIARQNLDQKVRHSDEAGRRYAAGVATDYDVLAAQVAVDNARPEVIRAENRIRSAKDRLRNLLALEDDLEVNGTLEKGAGAEVPYAAALETARKRRPELEELRRRIDIYGELVKIDGAGDKPRLDFKGGVGWRQLQVGDMSGDGKAWSAGIYLTFPLFDGLKTRGKVAQTESERRSLEIDESRLTEAISLEIRDAVNAVHESGEIVKALSGTVSQAERLLTMAEKGYELGVKIRLEVEDAELNLLQSRGNLARARRDYLVALVTLERAMGVLGEGG